MLSTTFYNAPIKLAEISEDLGEAMSATSARYISMLGHLPIKVKTINYFDNLDRLILPGGESTTIANILRSTNLGLVLEFKKQNYTEIHITLKLLF